MVGGGTNQRILRSSPTVRELDVKMKLSSDNESVPRLLSSSRTLSLLSSVLALLC